MDRPVLCTRNEFRLLKALALDRMALWAVDVFDRDAFTDYEEIERMKKSLIEALSPWWDEYHRVPAEEHIGELLKRRIIDWLKK